MLALPPHIEPKIPVWEFLFLDGRKYYMCGIDPYTENGILVYPKGRAAPPTESEYLAMVKECCRIFDESGTII